MRTCKEGRIVAEKAFTNINYDLGITKCSFGLDYMKHYVCPEVERQIDKESRILGLQGYDSNGTGNTHINTGLMHLPANHTLEMT